MNAVQDCEFCGRQVILCRDPDHPRVVRAMDTVESRMTMPAYWTVDGDGYIRPGGALLKHQCPATQMSGYVARSLSMSQRGVHVTNAAYARPCPKCGAQPGTECWNMSELKRGELSHTVNPHDVRYDPLPNEEPLTAPEPVDANDVEGAVKWATGEIDEEWT